MYRWLLVLCLGMISACAHAPRAGDVPAPEKNGFWIEVAQGTDPTFETYECTTYDFDQKPHETFTAKTGAFYALSHVNVYVLCSHKVQLPPNGRNWTYYAHLRTQGVCAMRNEIDFTCGKVTQLQFKMPSSV